jgi:hypothetical protein
MTDKTDKPWHDSQPDGFAAEGEPRELTQAELDEAVDKASGRVSIYTDYALQTAGYQVAYNHVDCAAMLDRVIELERKMESIGGVLHAIAAFCGHKEKK